MPSIFIGDTTDRVVAEKVAAELVHSRTDFSYKYTGRYEFTVDDSERNTLASIIEQVEANVYD